MKKKRAQEVSADHTSLLAEIQAVVDGQLAAGAVVRASWVTQAVVQARGALSGDDAGWYRSRAYESVRAAVGELVRRSGGDEDGESDAALVLPGFEKLQARYLITREGEACIVPLDDLTEEEMLAKLRQFRRNMAGLQKHYDELDAFRMRKFGGVAVGE